MPTPNVPDVADLPDHVRHELQRIATDPPEVHAPELNAAGAALWNVYRDFKTRRDGRAFAAEFTDHRGTKQVIRGSSYGELYRRAARRYLGMSDDGAADSRA
ncbi:hypothetical protein J421_0055 [Gemmatirosa kalamazoonensis]|uniref:Uncharacterized protein n=1 Tax=Gemmatirosa kalamazoonensis TaxID=861299 RepID=W0R9U2_9BACT|nr:hypothetical protein [Gemmatirosa kalamazoonensis]AHG87548.1 hypothetical protein J421_0010 [Gemmatirosa kalamazoonensis]AHG87571.1 hypothetical protein J421_0033 [Gemmatirosa kalamazoonensis]AHG87592.1 hypothetical protein J421_0055 [Gemmatirosa kalamazoonensis]